MSTHGTLRLLGVAGLAGVFATGFACAALQPVEGGLPLETGLDANGNGGNGGADDTGDTSALPGGNNNGNGTQSGPNTPPRAVVAITWAAGGTNSDGEPIPGFTASLDGSGSVDLDSDPLDYNWILLQKPVGSVSSLGDPTAPTTEIYLDRDGTYQIEFTVSDGQAFDTVQRSFEVVPDNLPPIADAGIDQRVNVGQQAFLSGAGSNDPDGDDLLYNWRFISRPPGSGATLSNASPPSAAVSPYFIADVAGIYTIELVVDDGTVKSQPDLVQVSATDPNASGSSSSSSSSSGDCLDCAAEATGVASRGFTSGGLASSLGLLLLPIFVALFHRRRD